MASVPSISNVKYRYSSIAMAEHPWITGSLMEDDCWRLEERGDPITSLSLSDKQCPDFVTLIGGTCKSKLLRELVAYAPTPHHEVHLCAEPRSYRGDTPRIFIDCGLHRERPRSARQSDLEISPRRYWKISWAKQQGYSNNIAHLFYSRVLAPLSSVVCYFAPDLGGLRGVAKLIAHQLISGSPNRLQSEALPRALVVVDTSSYVFDACVEETRLLDEISSALQESGRPSKLEDVWPDLLSHFHNIRVLGLQKDASPELRSRILRRRIASVSASVQSGRRNSQTLFAAHHSFNFFGMLIDNFCDGQNSFDFIKSSRAVGFSLRDFPVHLKDLFDTMPSEAWLWHTVTSLVASTLFLASYPPGSHCEQF